MNISSSLISTGVILIALLNMQSSWSAKMYKWVDKEGKVSYQDSPPPIGAKLIKEEEISAANKTSTNYIAQLEMPVSLYTVERCELCESLLLQLKNWGITAQEKSLHDREAQTRILKISDSLTAPTLFIGNNLISDISNSNITLELQKAGYQITVSEDLEIVDSDTSQ